MYDKEERLANSITLFSIVALILTCMGVLGQIFILCLNQVKEIGIRKVNGARIYEIMILLIREFAWSMLVSFIIAAPIAYYIMEKWLENFAYKTTLSWWVFALAGVMIFMIILLTIIWQSWKAATRNPVEALRYE